MPLGAPVFLSLDRAEPNGLWIAQDTGGAIRGVVRGDIFFGWGDAAEAAAGETNAPANFVVLVPR